MRKTVTTAQVKTTEQFCISNATVAAFSLPVLSQLTMIQYHLITMKMKHMRVVVMVKTW